MKVLFFAPHSAIWIHAFPEALVAEALVHEGHEIVYVTCGRQLEAGCVAMSALGVFSDASSERKAEVCRRCEGNKRILIREFGFSGCDLSDALTTEDLVETDRILSDITRDNFFELAVSGVDVGRIALYEFLLDRKKSTLGFETDAEWRQYLVGLKNTLYAVLGGKRLLEKELPDAVVVYNALYSLNRAVCELATARGISHYFLHAGGNLAHRLQTLLLAKGNTFDLLRHAVEVWPAYRDVPIDSQIAQTVTDHFLELLRGRSVFAYSAPRSVDKKNFVEKFGISSSQKVICATLSSYDERFAAETIGALVQSKDLLFPTQARWVEALIEFVRTRPDRFLVIRVHPREFPNKREGVKSLHASKLEAMLRNLPSNVAVNWPTDGLSLYDLAEIVDVFLNAWSSVGKEMSLLGIPVVLYSSDLPLYPADINYLGTTYQTYFDAVEQAITDGWQPKNIVRTYRWCAIEYARMLVDISDAYGGTEHLPVGILDRVRAKLFRTFFPYRQQLFDCRTRPTQPRSESAINAFFISGAQTVLDLEHPALASQESVSSELAVLRREIGRILKVMYPGGHVGKSKLGAKLEMFVRGLNGA